MPTTETKPIDTDNDSAINDYWHIRINKQCTKRWLRRTGVISILVLLTLAVVLPLYCDYTERTRISGLLIYLSAAKGPITEQLEADPQARIKLDANQLIPSDLKVRTEKGEYATFSYKSVSERGEIIAFSPQFGTLFVLTPRVESGKVEWSCWVSRHVVKGIPTACRTPMKAPSNTEPEGQIQSVGKDEA